MKKLLFCLVLFACSATTFAENPPKKAGKKLPLPPGTVKVADNFYADTKEISNINYLEYLYWLELIYGTHSAEHQAAQPNTLVWMDSLTYSEPFAEVYFRHPAYLDYPVVGISYAQAQAYAQWRSNIVFESIVLEHHKIDAVEYLKQRNAENVFTIERYFAGEIKGITPNKSLPVFRYRLPTAEEWEQLAGGGADIVQFPYGIDIEKASKKQKKTDSPFDSPSIFNIKPSAEEIAKVPILALYDCTNIAPTAAFQRNKYGLYNMIGNVAEMTATEGIAKGGSFYHTLDESPIVAEFPYKKPAAWLGFRCVAEYVYYDK